ncbi:hypothetical protein [Flavobacterium sp. ACN6]|uniref:hypothetical protein n=1 Tax=Flavobacterium sp. ACN6 TaxID=1920426 RepID=UPI0011450D27|nr:hypothetical protein [Flavobacterium sp. ACN6]PBJ10212.1 hypothetical protein BSF42_32810 [Flavobacterium sp. ACN6]
MRRIKNCLFQKIYNPPCLLMKQLKLIAFILVFLSAFSSSRGASHKYSTGSASYPIAQDLTTFNTTSFSSSFTLKDNNLDDLDVPLTPKKKIKHRATVTEKSALRTPYIAKSENFKIFKTQLIYGIATTYQIQRHNYLHLYQLF